MTKRSLPLNRITAVGVDKVALIDVPTGPRYHKIYLEVMATGQTLTTIIGDIVIKINDKPVRTHTADQLNQLNGLMGAAYGVKNNVAGSLIRLPIFFAEPWRKEYRSGDSLAWGTANIEDGDFQIEVTIKPGADASVTLKAMAVVDDLRANLVGITKMVRTNVDVSGDVSDYFGFSRQDAYQSVHFFDADIDAVEIIADNAPLRKITAAQNEDNLTDHEMVPSASRFDVVFDEDDVLSSAFPLRVSDGNGNMVQRVNEFLFKLTLGDTTPRPVTTIVQRYGNPGN